MKEGWEYKIIGSLCDIKTGKLDANAASPNGKYPFFTCSRETLKIDNYAYDCECVLVAGNGELNAKYYKGKFNAYQRTYIISLKPNTNEISIKYLYCFFSKYIETLRQRSIGGVIKYIKLGDLTNAQIPVPDYSRQLIIVEELDLLSSIIEKKKAQLNELDNLAQSLFYEMFGDPITNEKGWRTKTFKDIATFKNGLNYHPTDNGHVIKCIGVGDFQDRKELSDFDQIKDFSISEAVDESYYLQDGDIIIVRSNGSRELVGRNMVVFPKGKKVTYSGFCIRCRVSTTDILPIILNRILANRSTMIVLRQEGRGCNISNINQKILSSLTVIMPPIELQTEYVQKVKVIEHQKELIKQSIKEVETLFNSRMDYYFN